MAGHVPTTALTYPNAKAPKHGKPRLVMKIAIGGDHAGYALKDELIPLIEAAGHEVIDMGAHSAEPSDYPDFARSVGGAVRDGRAERGILVCGSGAGVTVAANKIHGVRATLAHDVYTAHQGVEHDDINIITMGARIIGPAIAKEVVTAFLNAKFSNEERHVRRVGKVLEIEAEN